MTPNHLHKIDTNYAPYCWKKCGYLGTHIHRCQEVASFWAKVRNQIIEWLGVNIPFNPEFLLLDYWPDTYV